MVSPQCPSSTLSMHAALACLAMHHMILHLRDVMTDVVNYLELSVGAQMLPQNPSQSLGQSRAVGECIVPSRPHSVEVGLSLSTEDWSCCQLTVAQSISPFRSDPSITRALILRLDSSDMLAADLVPQTS